MLEDYDKWFKKAKKAGCRYKGRRKVTAKQSAHRDKIKIWQEPRKKKAIMPMYRGGSAN